MSTKELTHPKRFITENNAEGKAVFSTQIPEELPAKVIDCGDKFFLGYTTNERPVDINDNKDVDTYSNYLANPPGIVIPGGTVLRYVDIRPGGVSPMHRTVSLDYGVVVEGQVIIRLDSGESRLMQRGDVTIQRGTMHEWENASKTEWARMMYVLQDSKPLIAGGKSLGEEYGEGMGDLPAIAVAVASGPLGASRPLPSGDSGAYEALVNSDSESSNSFADSEPDHNPDPCPWRTTQFHDQECSLFFDCPSHIVERSLSAAGSIHEGAVHEDGSMPDPDPASDGGDQNDRGAILISESAQRDDDIYDAQQSPDLEEIHSRALTAEIIDPATPTETTDAFTGSNDLMNALPALPITPTQDEDTSGSRSGADAGSEPTNIPLDQTEGHPGSGGEVERGLPGLPELRRERTPVSRERMDAPLPSPRRTSSAVLPPLPPPPQGEVEGSTTSECLVSSCANITAGNVEELSATRVRRTGSSFRISTSFGFLVQITSAKPRYIDGHVTTVFTSTIPEQCRGPIWDFARVKSTWRNLRSWNWHRRISGTQGSGSAHGSSSRRARSGTHQTPIERLLSGGSSSSYPNRYSPHSEVASSSQQRALPPTPQIAEEDECPICHRELPSQGLPNSEALRESHITTCIQTHSTYGTPRSGDEAAAPPAAPRRTGMYTYPATEKDCIDDAECTICLEEFTVGVPMARLECLCRFHRSCISAWFVNHPGRCPVHQHDGFGY
ncbi:hypothetical protein G7Z17_g6404 [Cylindrodendrum hubeiense]|uniref:RING-type domain-containing protein n=1 Tax=Cylindrodendrum hubeiense TaxID=595255 RepID=A0A9P5HD79_9HYPO|nr:hypothetical protein G7Z17_g6404 [Cylindrodendrum hubeiense]